MIINNTFPCKVHFFDYPVEEISSYAVVVSLQKLERKHL